MLASKGLGFKDSVVAISGAGNVAQYATRKAMDLGAKVVTLSDSNGFIYDPDGIDDEKWKFVMFLKNARRGRISEYAEKYPTATYYEGKRPWGIKCDIALPCATQNEIELEDAKALIAGGCRCVCEGANMPTTPDAIAAIQAAGLLYSPGKASNAGGVATSALEMSQNSERLSWTFEEVDQKLQGIMINIYHNIAEAAKRYGKEGDYVAGANIAGFEKVCEAMLAQGVV
jgi:glutamate dehydrogenase (NADP+)